MILKLLKYHFCDDFVNKRLPYRNNHLKYIRGAVESGVAKAGGAYGDPISDGLIIFACSEQEVQQFVDNDPYYKAGLVLDYSIVDWFIVAGEPTFS